jgi:hypothetical protein
MIWALLFHNCQPEGAEGHKHKGKQKRDPVYRAEDHLDDQGALYQPTGSCQLWINTE